MRIGKVNAIFIAAAILAIAGFLSRGTVTDKLDKMKQFKLSDVELESMDGLPYRIPPGYFGYVVFYADTLQCASCIRDVAAFKDLIEIYDGLGFWAVVRGGKFKPAFAQLMLRFEIPGDYLADPRGRIQDRLGLIQSPMLLFFDSEQRLIAVMPLDVPHDNIIKQFHRYLSVM